MLKAVLRVIGAGVAIVAVMIGLMSEAPEGAPISQQLMIWAGALGVAFLGYLLYRLAGGAFSLRELGESE